MEIKKNEIKYLQKRRRDDVGEIFIWEGKILRGIYHHQTPMVKSFFDSGFILELIEKELFPNSWISEYTSKDYGVIVEHHKIDPVIYPQEWTFSMLKDSALAVLQVAKIAGKYGYNMKDCHGFNILMEGNKPKFIDLGSFHPNREGCTGWEPYGEFLRFYYFPLFMWKDGMEYTSKLSIFSANLMQPTEHFVYRYRFLRFLRGKLLERLIKFVFLFSNIARMDYMSMNKKFQKKNKLVTSGAKTVKELINRSGIFISQDLVKLENRIQKIKRKELNTPWKEYHSLISKKSNRFEKIIDFVNIHCSDARTAIDIAGNQGMFSSMVLQETGIERIICQDLDEQAIDIGYNAQKGNENISFVNYNFIAPIVKTTHPFPHDRFKADITFALALLHHLILTQGFDLDDILIELDKYTNKYVCVEFMPRGLWVYKDGSQVNIPEWYTSDWFRDNFLKHFDLLAEEQIAENYIVFIGKKRKQGNG
jgi:hypothetical protein